MPDEPIAAAPPPVAPGFTWAWLLLPLAAGALLIGMEATDVDRVIERRFFDPAAGAFPLRHDPFLEVVLHYWTTSLVALTACCALAGFAASYTIPALRRQRGLLLFIALAIILSTAAVSAAKRFSGKHCPWDLAEYGGSLPYTRLFDAPPSALEPGHCFPAGHASTGFSLLAFYFTGCACRNSRAARAGLVLGLSAGLGLGLGRMIQGAHFLSHVLWSGLLCWLVIVAVYLALYGHSRRPGEAPAGAGTRQR